MSNSRLPIASTHFITSISQPLASRPSSLRKRVFLHRVRTSPFGCGCPSRTMKILPDVGTSFGRIFDPIQPARRAVCFKGFRSSMISRTKKCLGTTIRLTTVNCLRVVVQQKETGIVAGGQAIAFGPEGAINYFGAEGSLPTLEFEFLSARCTEEISNRTVVWKRIDSGGAAIRAIHLVADPSLGPESGALCAAAVRRLRFFKAQFHSTSPSNAGEGSHTIPQARATAPADSMHGISRACHPPSVPWRPGRWGFDPVRARLVERQLARRPPGPIARRASPLARPPDPQAFLPAGL